MGRRKKSTTKSKGRTKSGKKQTKLKIPGPKGSSTAENLVQLMLLGSDLIEKHTRKKAAQEAKTNANPPRKNLSFRPPRVLTKSKDLFFHLCSLLVFVLVRSFCPLFHLHSLTFFILLVFMRDKQDWSCDHLFRWKWQLYPSQAGKASTKEDFWPSCWYDLPAYHICLLIHE